jgi:aminocarboxymuconate-semialdehyde decarboxylase
MVCFHSLMHLGNMNDSYSNVPCAIDVSFFSFLRFRSFERIVGMDQSSTVARIDIHAHILPKELSPNARKYLELRPHADGDPRLDMYKDGRFFRTIEPNCFDVDVRLREMDENHIAMQVLSTIPVLFNYASEKVEEVLQLSRELNDHIASICRQHPNRFVGLGTVPMQEPTVAIEELRRCVVEIGLKGVQINTHVNQWCLDHEKLHPFWEAVQELDACVFIHPWDMPTGNHYDAYWMPWLCG